MRSATQKPPVSSPKQHRSRQTYERILNAVSRLVSENAYEGATVSEIVRQANCSVGAFYGRFADKDAAMFALYDARCSELEDRVLAILESGREPAAPLTKTISRFVDCVIDHTFSNAAFIKAERYLSSAKTAEPFWARAKRMNTAFFKGLANVLEVKASEMTHNNPKTAAMITLSIIGGLPRDAVKNASRLVDSPSQHVADYKSEIRRVVFGYLGIA